MKDRNVLLILMLMCAALSSPLFAQPTVADVEALVPGGVYLDFMGSGEASTNGEYTVTTDASDWNYPDGSDSDWHVNEGCYDSKSGNGSDFAATISGLASGGVYSVYVTSMYDSGNYGYSWGLAVASENEVDPVVPENGIYIAGQGEGAKGTYLYLLQEDDFQASAAGEIVIHFGKFGSRTQYDGVLVVENDPTFNPAPKVDAGADQTGYLSDTFQLSGSVSDMGSADGTSSIGGIDSFFWSQESGPGTATFSATDVLDPTVTFEAAGTYELFLTATDLDAKDANDAVIIYVGDHANDKLMAHWEFDVIDGAYDVVDSVGDAYGNLVKGDGDANGIPEYVPGWIGDYALSFSGDGYVDVNATPDFNAEPLLANSISAWIKVTTFDKEWQAVVSRGDDSWRLARTGNSDSMSFHLSGTSSYPNGSINVNDGLWHHVAGSYDGVRSRLYIDGVLDADQAVTGLISMSSNPIVIGGQLHDSPDAEREWDGMIDDVRIYNYGLSESEVLALTGMGSVAPMVDAGPDQARQLKPGETIVLSGSVIDNGIPSAITISWATVSGPDGAEAIFTDASSAETTVGFPNFGNYELSLTAEDDLAIVTATVQIEVTSPTCADVISDGLLLVSDISGPDGTPDCRVDICDVAAMAVAWLTCNDPGDIACDFPY